MFAHLLLLLALPSMIHAIAIDNGIVGDPEVQCGPTDVQVSFTARNPFGGVVYAKNHYAEEKCVSKGDGNNKGGGIRIGFNDCNAQRFRSLDPRGVFVTVTVVVQFHTTVLTKIDRAYHIRCFYMEADKTVDAQLEVSMVTTDLITLTVPMPVCRYEILDRDSKQPIKFALIGDKIIHKWTCDTETQDTFCMEVYSCFVNDAEKGANLDLIDESGCSLDGNLVPNPTYPTDLMGEAEAHVFKWADRPALYFNCQIRIGIKEPNSKCEDWRHAQGPAGACPTEPLTLGRKKRSAHRLPKVSVSSPGVQETDVAPAFPLFVADLELTQEDIPESLRSISSFNNQANVSHQSNDVCLSSVHVGIIFAILALLFMLATGLSVAVFCRRSKN